LHVSGIRTGFISSLSVNFAQALYEAIEEGIIEIGSKLPINPSSGLTGCGHFVGTTGARQLLDAYKQVADKAGDYRVAGAKRVATLNTGSTAITNVCFVVDK